MVGSFGTLVNPAKKSQWLQDCPSQDLLAMRAQHVGEAFP